MLGGPRGGVQPSHCQNFFFIKKKLETPPPPPKKKNQGNQVIVLLWCSHYDINDVPEPAQTGGEN